MPHTRDTLELYKMYRLTIFLHYGATIEFPGKGWGGGDGVICMGEDMFTCCTNILPQFTYKYTIKYVKYIMYFTNLGPKVSKTPNPSSFGILMLVAFLRAEVSTLSVVGRLSETQLYAIQL